MREVLLLYLWYVDRPKELAVDACGVLKIQRATSTPWPSQDEVFWWYKGTQILALLSLPDCAATLAAVCSCSSPPVDRGCP